MQKNTRSDIKIQKYSSTTDICTNQQTKNVKARDPVGSQKFQKNTAETTKLENIGCIDIENVTITKHEKNHIHK